MVFSRRAFYQSRLGSAFTQLQFSTWKDYHQTSKIRLLVDIKVVLVDCCRRLSFFSLKLPETVAKDIRDATPRHGWVSMSEERSTFHGLSCLGLFSFTMYHMCIV